MAGNQSSFSWKAGTLLVNTKHFNERANKAVGAAFEFQATKSEAYMKTNAKWKDDTGNARNSLFTAVEHNGTEHKLLLSHGVSYGLWLELRFSGKYAIVMPAWLLAQADLRRLLSKLFDGLGSVKI